MPTPYSSVSCRWRSQLGWLAVGQLLVAVFDVGFLSPMEAWYSGLIPYPVLLAIQFVILASQFEISRELWVGAGGVSAPRPVLGRMLAGLSVVYFLTMVARYLVTNVMPPDAGWFGDTIPIVFHGVLAAYMWVLSRHLRRLPVLGESAWKTSRTT